MRLFTTAILCNTNYCISPQIKSKTQCPGNRIAAKTLDLMLQDLFLFGCVISVFNSFHGVEAALLIDSDWCSLYPELHCSDELKRLRVRCKRSHRIPIWCVIICLIKVVNKIPLSVHKEEDFQTCWQLQIDCF